MFATNNFPTSNATTNDHLNATMFVYAIFLENKSIQS